MSARPALRHPAPPRRRGGVASAFGLLFAAMGLGALGTLSPPLAVLIAFGLLPGATALFVDTRRPRHLGWTVTGLNVAALFPFIAVMWQRREERGAALALLTDPMTWLTIFAAAAAGYLLFLFVPICAEAVLEAREDRAARNLGQDAGALEAEWGPDIST